MLRSLSKQSLFCIFSIHPPSGHHRLTDDEIGPENKEEKENWTRLITCGGLNEVQLIASWMEILKVRCAASWKQNKRTNEGINRRSALRY